MKPSSVLPLEWMRIVPIEKLQAGDFAIFIEDEFKPVLVGQQEGAALGVYLTDSKCSVSDLRYHDSNALVIHDWQVEIDYSAMAKLDHLESKYGALVASDGKVAIACKPPTGHGYGILPIADRDVPKAPAKYAYPAWRLFKMRDDEKIILFERGPVSL